MKVLFQLISTLVLAIVFQWFFPWWSLAGSAAIVAAWFPWRRARTPILVGFLAGFLLWGEYALLRDWQNEHILSSKIGALFGDLSPVQLVGLTALLGGIVASIGAWVGYEAQRLWAPRRA